MKIAIADDKGNVSEHFGYCEGFRMYEIEEGKPSETDYVENPGHRPGFLPEFLKEQGINVIISGGMGGSAQKLFNENDIVAIVGAEGKSEKVIEDYLSGKIKSTGEFC